ncbi:tryptophan--tRNA ligase [Candidatus Paracaedibacter symbiosus]|uniref:tryptophan--tRNA ligase n=1 Tax=Candidatus Paracaedibacter symbiosus TaxID=244582 RepID=UPI000A0439F8
MHRILSGIRPTGDIHLGNYLGAVRNWVEMQHLSQQNLFCIVDLHALTTLQDTDNLADHTRTVAAAYIASGIDPNKSAIFAQSHVPYHAELGWILGCFAPLGWLNRMTQFKEKAGKHKELACLGLYAYPVLMAADILLYKASHVPVGEDQKQHLELARDLAGAFNHRFNSDLFPVPEPIIQGPATRVMSLRDGTSKMSKSDISEYSRINLMDTPDMIVQKIRKAKTDMEPLPETVEGLENRPEAQNLVNIFAAISGISAADICARFAGSNFAPFKQELADHLIEKIAPVGTQMRHLLKETSELDKVLAAGADVANKLAATHMVEIRSVIGLLQER